MRSLDLSDTFPSVARELPCCEAGESTQVTVPRYVQWEAYKASHCSHCSPSGGLPSVEFGMLSCASAPDRTLTSAPCQSMPILPTLRAVCSTPHERPRSSTDSHIQDHWYEPSLVKGEVKKTSTAILSSAHPKLVLRRSMMILLFTVYNRSPGIGIGIGGARNSTGRRNCLAFPPALLNKVGAPFYRRHVLDYVSNGRQLPEVLMKERIRKAARWLTVLSQSMRWTSMRRCEMHPT